MGTLERLRSAAMDWDASDRNSAKPDRVINACDLMVTVAGEWVQAGCPGYEDNATEARGLAKVVLHGGKVRVADARSGEGWGLYWCPLRDDDTPDEDYEPTDEDLIAWPFGDAFMTSNDMRSNGYIVFI